VLRSTRTRPTEASFDLTPMIDVVMLLIVFFTLTSQFRDAIPTTVDLPREVGQEAAEAAPASISLELRRDGTLASNGREVGLDEIITHIASGSESARAARSELVLRADRMCPVGEVNRVTRALAEAGVRRLKVVTAAEGAPAGVRR
jgi:biopolymer transport protein ExbD